MALAAFHDRFHYYLNMHRSSHCYDAALQRRLSIRITHSRTLFGAHIKSPLGNDRRVLLLFLMDHESNKSSNILFYSHEFTLIKTKAFFG